MMAAAATDTRQLLLQVDASISLAQRNLNQLASQVQREAQQMDQALGKVDAATERMGQSFARQRARGRENVISLGQMRAGAQQLSFQIGDVAQQFSMGVRPMTIFAQQSGQVVQALTMMRGGTSGLLGFLGGPWGAIMTGAGIIAASFAGKLFESSDAVDELVKKMREKAEQTRNNILADEAWKRTVEGLTEAIRKRREEQEKALQTDIQAEHAALGAARGELRQAEGQRERVARQLQAANRQLEEMRARGPGSSVPGRQFSQGEIAQQQSRVDELRQSLATIMAGVRSAEQSVRGAEITIGERRVEGQLDAVKAATDRYTEALGRLREERKKGLISQAEFERRLRDEAKRRDAAIDATKQRGRSSLQREIGAEFGLSDAVGIVRGMGGTVTSTTRSPEHNRRVGGVAGSFHLTGQAVDVAKGAGITLNKLVAAFRARGARILEALDEGDHFHIAFKAMTAAQEKAAADASRAAEEAARNLAEHNRDMEQTNEEILRHRLQQAGTADQAAAIELQLIDAQHKRLEAEVAEAVRRGDRTQQQADEFLARQEIINQMRRQAVEQKRVADNAREQLLGVETTLGIRQEILEGDRSLARTAAERRQIEFELVDIMFQIRLARLEEAKQAALLAGRTAEAARIQEEINALPRMRDQAREESRRGTMSPLEAWMDSVPSTAAEVIEALQAIQARGLDMLADGLTDVIMGTRSLKEAFGDMARAILADILRMSLRMLIMQTLMRALGLGGGGTSVWPEHSIGTNPTGGAVGMAGGGSVYPGQAVTVGEHGRERFIPKVPGVIVPNHALRNGGGGGGIVEVRLRDELLEARIADGADVRIVRAAPILRADAVRAVSERSRRA